RNAGRHEIHGADGGSPTPPRRRGKPPATTPTARTANTADRPATHRRARRDSTPARRRPRETNRDRPGCTPAGSGRYRGKERPESASGLPATAGKYAPATAGSWTSDAQKISRES